MQNLRNNIPFIFCLSLIWLVFSCHNPGPDDLQIQKRPNVIIILVDALRADSLGCYGQPGDLSPFIDDYSRKGVTFMNAFSHSTHTTISVASLFTGLIPPAHGVRRAGTPIKKVEKKLASDVMSYELMTMAELFKQNGYNTCGINTNHNIDRKSGFAQGFDSYTMIPGKWLESHGIRSWMGHDGSKVNQMALEWLSSSSKEPFFLFLHYMDVHAPYLPPREYYQVTMNEVLSPLAVVKNGPFTGNITDEIISFNKRMYYSEIKYFDHLFFGLINELDKRGLLSNTIVVITSDHGDEFHEHGGFGHNFNIYDEVLHVPLIVTWPGAIPTDLTREDQVRLIDIMPTLARLAGIDTSSIQIQGQDLFTRGWTDQQPLAFWKRTGPLPLYAETYRLNIPRCLRMPDRKLIYNHADGSYEFYRLDQDPGEMNNLYEDGNKEIEKMKATLHEMINLPFIAETRPEPMVLDQETRDILESLGYLDD